MFFIKAAYYTLLLFTTLLNIYYIYEGLLGRGGGLPYMRQVMAVASLPAIWFIYRAFLLGEKQEQWVAALGQLLICWLIWGISIGFYFLIFKHRN